MCVDSGADIVQSWFFEKYIPTLEHITFLLKTLLYFK